MSALDTLIYGYRTILASAVAVAQRNKLNFGAGFTVADNPGTSSTDITLTGSSGTPTGTGIPHVVAGVMNAATSLIVNADVSASAAVAVSKLAAGTNGQTLRTIAGAAAWGDLYDTADVATAGTIDDLAISSTAPIALLRFTDAGGPTLTSIVPGASSRIVFVVAAGALGMTLGSAAASGTAANRFLFQGGDLILSQDHVAILFYDPTTARWRGNVLT